MKKFLTCAVSLAMVIALSASARAAGVGAYFDFDPSGGTAYVDQANPLGSASVSVLNFFVGAGAVVDTNLMGTSIFNYRMKLGGEKVLGRDDLNFDGAAGHLQNIFGFRLHRTNKMKLWLGPMIGFRYITGDEEGIRFSNEGQGFLDHLYEIGSGYTYMSWSGIFGNIGIHSVKDEYSLFGLDTGLVFGMNFLVIKNVVVSGELAAKYLLLAGKRTRTVITLSSITQGEIDFNEFKGDVIAHNFDINLSLSAMYRFNE